MFESTRRYYLYNCPVDMRKSFNTLCGVVRHKMNMEIQENVGYVFINKRATHMKILCWQDYRISYEKLLLILRGISIQKIIKRKRYKLGG
jgi:hypothetical protein